MHPKNHILLFLFLIIGLISCSKFSSKPVIKVYDPFQHTHFTAGDSFDVKAEFSDSKGLVFYHVCVSDASGNPNTDFLVEDSGELSGKEYTYIRAVQTPQSANGTYYLHFIVEDSDGKRSESFHEFHIDQ
jgi:hypothetical protein